MNDNKKEPVSPSRPLNCSVAPFLHELFWVQEGTVDRIPQISVFCFPIAKETSKTYVAQEKNQNSFNLKVVNKREIGVRFFCSEYEALQAKLAELERRDPERTHAYCQEQIKNIKARLFRLGL